MSTLLSPRQRPLRVCSYHYDPRFVDDTLEQVEHELSKVHDFEIISLSSLDAPEFDPCDLLILMAQQLQDSELTQWTKGLAHRLRHKIWTPALIVASPGFQVLSELTTFALGSNWYFDVVDAEHIPSLPLRITNLIRIHDHLHEMYRYEKTLSSLEQKLQSIKT